MTANLRIQWLHDKISEMQYPNAMRLAEKFGISHRQAQRDVNFLKNELNAPLKYDAARKGFYYCSDFSLPVYFTTANDEEYIVSMAGSAGYVSEKSGRSVMQMQIPYSALVEIKDKLTAIKFGKFIIDEKSPNQYICEFHSIELFLGAILSAESSVKILKPDWLRARLLSAAEKVIFANK